jgi:hypothetical protein
MVRKRAWAKWWRVESRRATVALFVDGVWAGASRLDLPSAAHSSSLGDYAYRLAEQMAAVRGYMLDRFHEAEPEEE